LITTIFCFSETLPVDWPISEIIVSDWFYKKNKIYKIYHFLRPKAPFFPKKKRKIEKKNVQNIHPKRLAQNSIGLK
jgi:hypothetical protein